jgi:ribosomal protein S18 acetylase RimI-like enzyme
MLVKIAILTYYGQSEESELDKFRIRKAVPNDAERMAQILVAGNRTVFTGLVPEKCLDFPVEESRRNWRETLVENETSQEWLLTVAENEAGLVVAYGMFGRNSRLPEFASELLSLAVDPAWQRQGIGRLLVQHGAAFYQQQGLNSMLVGVLELNPNTVFYERLGAKLVGERPYSWNGFKTTELLYGWDELTVLTNLRGS